MAKKLVMTAFKKKTCELDAKSIAYYRRNPLIAAADLLGVQLLDAQAYMLESTWNAPHSLWVCSRNFGKSFIGAILMILKALLYENQSIYIVSSVGDQSKETFNKIEEIIRRIGKTSESNKSLKDIAENETKKGTTNKTGFSHNPAGFEVTFYNGSGIYTLNSNPDSNRSRRASLVFFDEAAFCSDELIAVCEAFATQNSDFSMSTEEEYNPDTDTRQCPTQLVYASSQDEMSKLFYKHYKNFSKRFLAGDRDYFVCDMICDTAIKTFRFGKPYTPLLTQDKVDAALKSNRDKARREYYNEPTRDGGVSQIVKWATIRRNEKFYLPQLIGAKNQKFTLAFDPARSYDNSIISTMFLTQDPELGLCGDIVNCVNFLDLSSRKRYKLDSNRQLDEIRDLLLAYNNGEPDFENLDVLMIDAGAGGGGVSTYGDQLLKSWTDKTGKEHRGLIDLTFPQYEGYEELYPDDSDKMRLIEPRKYRTKMVEEFIELMDLGVLRLPYASSGSDSLQIIQHGLKEDTVTNYQLSEDERLALMQIDLMKEEITSIHRSSNAEHTSITYALAKEKENKYHDDRFYTAIMLAHRLYELRQGEEISNAISRVEATDSIDISCSCVTPLD